MNGPAGQPPPPSHGDEHLEGQRQKNSATRGLWLEYAPHRQRVTELLLAAAGQFEVPHLTVLGAGNCNDLDLAQLRTRYRAIYLVDCDADAVLQGIARQQLASDAAMKCVGPVDVSNIAAIQQLVSGGRDPLPQCDFSIPTEPVHVAASVCLLSQILDDVASKLGVNHWQYRQAIERVRLAHIQLLIELLVPGGIGLLVTDLVSSDTAPQLASATPLTLPRMVLDLVAERNFFTGLNPSIIHALLTTDPVLSPRASEVRVLHPWLWNLGQRIYAVYAVQFRRTG